MSGSGQGEKRRGSRQPKEGVILRHSIYIQKEIDQHRATIADRSWQLGKGVEQVGSWSVIKKYIPPQNEVSGGNWSPSTQERSEDQKQFGKARAVRKGGKRKILEVGGCLATGVKGLLSPCWDPTNSSGLAGRGRLTTTKGRSPEHKHQVLLLVLLGLLGYIIVGIVASAYLDHLDRGGIQVTFYSLAQIAYRNLLALFQDDVLVLTQAEEHRLLVLLHLLWG